MIKKFLQKIFKIIFYSFFSRVYGKIDGAIKYSSDSRIKVEIVNIEKDFKYKVYQITNGRLYTDRIHDTAVILDSKIIEGPSFQLRYTFDKKIFNSKIEDNVVFYKGTPRKLNNLNGSALSLLTGGGGNNNYWHWLFDVLPRLGLCSKSLDLKEIDYFLLPNLLEKFQNETLDFLNIPKHKRLSSNKFRHIKSKNLIVTDHPVVVSGDATEDIQNIPSWIILWLRSNFLIQNTLINKNNRKKIYIDRNDTTSSHSPQRYIVNEDMVKMHLVNKGFASVKLHEITVKEQVDLFNNAECIVGLHGGGFGNIVFCKPKTKVIELRSANAGPVIENLAKKNNLNYYSIIVEPEKLSQSKFPNQQGGINIPISSLDKILGNS